MGQIVIYLLMVQKSITLKLRTLKLLQCHYFLETFQRSFFYNLSVDDNAITVVCKKHGIVKIKCKSKNVKVKMFFTAMTILLAMH